MPKENKNKRDAEKAERKADQGFYREILLRQEEEKKRISQDLHDESGQMIVALAASLNVIEKQLKEGKVQEVFSLIEKNREMIQEVSGKMKSISLMLRPPALDVLGLAAVLREYFTQCTSSNPIKIQFNENIKDVRLGENIEIALYRIVQEAITNVLKHAQATLVKVNLILEQKRIQLLFADNGKGFDPEAYSRKYDSSKMGLRGIKERADILNGSLSIESSPKGGTRLAVVLPLE